MKTEDLIVDLARKGTAVAVVRPPWQRFAIWSAVAAAAVATALLIRGARADIGQVSGEGTFLAMAVLTIATALFAAVAALLPSVPGARGTGAAGAASLVALGGWAVLLGVPSVESGEPLDHLVREPRSLACLAKVVLIGIVPVGVMLVLARRAAPLRPRRTAGWAALAGLAAGAVGAQVLCPIDLAAHLLTWHFAPVVAVSLVALLLPAAWTGQPDLDARRTRI